jgi:hypothetical protein
MKGFRHTISLHIQHIQTDLVVIAKMIGIAGRKVPVNAPAYVPALGPNPNVFSHDQAAVSMYLDIALIIQDTFVGKNRNGYQQAQADDQATGMPEP